MNARRDVGPRLGRGLAALLGDAAVQAPPQGAGVRHVPLDLLEPNPYQPVAASTRPLWRSLPSRSGSAAYFTAPGTTAPGDSRPLPDRRGRAPLAGSRRRGPARGPALVHDMTDTEAAAVALVENLQRQDLNPIDEAEGYDRLLTQFAFTQEALGQAVGKSRSHIANTLRLLNLPPRVKEALQKGEISTGHARALLAHPAPEAGLREVIDRHLSVRQTEALPPATASGTHTGGRPAAQSRTGYPGPGALSERAARPDREGDLQRQARRHTVPLHRSRSVGQFTEQIWATTVIAK